MPEENRREPNGHEENGHEDSGGRASAAQELECGLLGEIGVLSFTANPPRVGRPSQLRAPDSLLRAGRHG